MLTLSRHHQLMIGLFLMMLVTATRGHHFYALHSLPSAAWAVFFLAGVYLCSAWALPVLFALVFTLDFIAVTWGGVSSFCISIAYIFLLPAYSSLWLAGHWYSKRYCFEWRTLLPLVSSLLFGATMCELFASGSFYFFSGRFTEPTLAEFGLRLQQYFPPYLKTLAFYITSAAVIHSLFRLTYKHVHRHSTASTRTGTS